jgi:hypothetical protein
VSALYQRYNNAEDSSTTSSFQIFPQFGLHPWYIRRFVNQCQSVAGQQSQESRQSDNNNNNSNNNVNNSNNDRPFDENITSQLLSELMRVLTIFPGAGVGE